MSGGLSSSIAGGNFWAGVRQGLITSGLNHLAHEVASGLEEVSNSNKKNANSTIINEKDKVCTGTITIDKSVPIAQLENIASLYSINISIFFSID